MRRLSRFELWMAVLTVLALAARLFRLGHQSLWVDEAMTVSWINEIHERGWGSMLQNIHGPLHTSFVYGMARLSCSEWSLRLPSALAGTLAVPALGFLGRALWGRRVGITSASLLVISPFALYYAQEVRGYSFTILFSSLAALTAWRWVQMPTWRWALLFLLCELLCMASNLNGVFLAIGLNSFLLGCFLRSRQALLPWLLVHLLLLLPLLPYSSQVQRQVRLERLFGVETNFGQKSALRGSTTLHPMALPYSAYALAAGTSLGPTLQELRAEPRSAARVRHLPALLLVLLGFGCPLVLGVLRPNAANGRRLLLIPSCLVVLFVVWLAALNMKPFNVRYLSVLLPYYLLLVARGLWILPRRWGVICALAALVVSLWSCGNYWFVPRYGRDDVRGALQFLRLHAAPEDLVLQISLLSPLDYYRDLRPPRVRHARPGSGESLQAASGYVRELSRLAPVLWYLECRPEGPDPHGYLVSALRSASKEQEKWQFVGINVYRFVFEGTM